MVVLTDEPISKVDFVRLLSCSFTNSWDNQTNRLSISLYSDDGSTMVKTDTLLPGFYTAADVAANFSGLFAAQNAWLKAFANTSDGEVAIYNPKNKNILMDQGHADFLGGISRALGVANDVKILNIPRNYYIHCTLVDPIKTS